ncbi:unnamed protein product [Clonostachys rosea f. rosea IK726]|uniref:Uncharacterized protein n=1 Tax=Clonostachys rosea f. rosea IK726 TaxID=1349383 RepID=A0ACA9UBA3_BIOOC|nr:unnamed protein product [Clonostachys rosea f. rosea IK726]
MDSVARERISFNARVETSFSPAQDLVRNDKKLGNDGEPRGVPKNRELSDHALALGMGFHYERGIFHYERDTPRLDTCREDGYGLANIASRFYGFRSGPLIQGPALGSGVTGNLIMRGDYAREGAER